MTCERAYVPGLEHHDLRRLRWSISEEAAGFPARTAGLTCSTIALGPLLPEGYVRLGRLRGQALERSIKGEGVAATQAEARRCVACPSAKPDAQTKLKERNMSGRILGLKRARSRGKASSGGLCFRTRHSRTAQCGRDLRAEICLTSTLSGKAATRASSSESCCRTISSKEVLSF